MKNWTIRQKMIPLYLIISFFTFLMFFAAFFIMRSIAAMPAEEAAGAEGIINTFGWMFIPYLLVYFVCIFVVGRMIAKQVAFPAKDLVEAAGKIAEGDLNVDLSHQSRDEMGVLTQSFREMRDSIQHQAGVVQAIAEGDYTAEYTAHGPGDVMGTAIVKMLENNNRLISQIRQAANQVNGGAAQIANTSQSLAQGSTQQAASVQELGATMAAVSATSAQNAEASTQALEVTRQAGERMEAGLASMQKVQQAMSAIDESSQKITNVIKVIDDIAFQTNILALNAAVEAARAGEHGKGFAVVADEVRNLAGKSAEAAKETAALIEGSRSSVQEGDAVVGKTGEDLRVVGELAGRTFELVQGIAKGSEEQKQSLEELARGLEQISSVVQANSATAEESAASAQEMSAQAEGLNRTVTQFKLRAGGGPLRPGLPQ